MRLKRIGNRFFKLFVLFAVTLLSSVLVMDILSINHGPSIEGGNTINPNPVPADRIGEDKYDFEGELDLDVFDLYFLEEGVSSSGEHKVIAPGTRNEHILYITNNFDFALDYKITYSSSFGNDIVLPILVKLRNNEGEYLIGSKSSYGHVKDLEAIDFNTLGSNRYQYYVFEWYWPFESEDDLGDTELGNLTIDQDVSLTLEVSLDAVASEDVDSKKGILLPKEKDELIAQSTLIGIAAVIGLIVLVYASRSMKINPYSE